jgi:hypothetical protein
VQDRHLDAAQPEDTGGPTRKTCLACGRAGNATHVCPSLFGGSGGLEHGVGGGGVPVASCQVHRRSCHVAIAASRCERERHGHLTRQGYWYCDNTGTVIILGTASDEAFKRTVETRRQRRA